MTNDVIMNMLILYGYDLTKEIIEEEIRLGLRPKTAMSEVHNTFQLLQDKLQKGELTYEYLALKRADTLLHMYLAHKFQWRSNSRFLKNGKSKAQYKARKNHFHE